MTPAPPRSDGDLGPAAPLASDVAALMAQRYGRRPGDAEKSRRRMWIVASICTVIGLAIMVMIAATLVRPTARAVDVGFEVVDNSRVRVIFDVTRPAEEPVTCTIEALNTSFGQVGLREVAIAPSPERTTRHTVEVATTELATTGIVRECRLNKILTSQEGDNQANIRDKSGEYP